MNELTMTGRSVRRCRNCGLSEHVAPPWSDCSRNINGQDIVFIDGHEFWTDGVIDRT